MTATPSHQNPADSKSGVPRRTLMVGAAWSVPAVAIAMAAPHASASGTPTYAIESSFGVGWYPTTQGSESSGALQYDADSGDKYLRVTGTSAGDVVTGIFFEVLFSQGWPAPTFAALPGSNPDWSTLSQVGTEVVGGQTYNVYRSTYAQPVVATGAITDIPVDFYFRFDSPYYAGNTAQTRRFATVNSATVTLVRNPAQINNTNVPLSQAPTP
ncbi:hypothetical protein [Microbacterium sp. SLBN-111]|uniref:hypothetical protein n=1 Tax=Microbacterium sp. SLBN-111 TaxID=3377733 RepID=UPI003C774ED6